MEIVIAVGLGAWFSLSGLIATMMVFRDYK